MLLKTLALENFKAFGRKQEITFAEPSPRSLGLTVIVGPNNGGKTTILKTIRQLVSTEEAFVAGADDRRQDPVKIELTGSVDGNTNFAISVEGRGSAARLKKTGTWTAALGTSLHYVPSRRPWTDKFHTQPTQPNVRKAHEDGAYLNSKQQEYYVDTQFGSSIASIEIDPVAKENYTKLLTRLEPTIVEWTIDNRETDFISFKSVSGAAHRCGLVGEGVANIFRLAYSLYDFKEGEVLLLDEPELSLHPQAQKRLYEELRKRARIGQIIVSTHSPYFVSWRDIRDGAKMYRSNQIQNNGSVLTTLEPQTISKIAKVADEKKNRKLYDVVAKEIFFSRGTLFVEGQEDAHIIADYVEENSLPPLEIFGYGSGGASLIASWLNLAQDLGIKAAAIFDGDAEGIAAFKQCSLEFILNKQILLKKLSTSDIRDKPRKDKDEKEKLGMFDKDWQLKPDHADEWHALLNEITAFLR